MKDEDFTEASLQVRESLAASVQLLISSSEH